MTTVTSKTKTSAVRFREISYDPKLSPIDVTEAPEDGGHVRYEARPPYVCSTYVSIATTCPLSCVFKGNGCFVQVGFARFSMKQLDDAAEGLSTTEVIKQEVTVWRWAFGGRPVPQDGAKGGRDLRLHVGGDVGRTKDARMLAVEADNWLNRRQGGLVWTYSHRWRDVPRRAWGRISVLGSVESPAAMEEAARAGYVPAIVVRRFPDGPRAFRVDGSSLLIIPCPAETSRVTCVECRLCLDDGKLRERGLAIGFEAHGKQAVAIRRRLPVLVGTTCGASTTHA